MPTMPPEFENIIRLIQTLPGVGRKSAMRIAFHFLKQPQEDITDFAQGLHQFHDHIKLCGTCFALKSVNEICQYCHSKRHNGQICVVEQPSDIFHVEQTGDFFGIYHVLLGVLNPLEGVHPQHIKLNQLYTRIKEDNNLQEVIVATNPSIEGDATAHYIASLLQDCTHVKISRIASGMATGSQLDFADAQMISRSFKARTEIIV